MKIKKCFFLLLFITLIVYASLYFSLKSLHSKPSDLFHLWIDSTANQTNKILLINFANDQLHELFSLDSKYPLYEWQPTHDYNGICGLTLITNNTICTWDLLQVNPNPPDEVVPNILHFILPFGGDDGRTTTDLDLLHSICILSAFWVIQPKFMILWYVDKIPNGLNWDYLETNLTLQSERVILMQLTKPTEIYDKPMKKKEYLSDVFRLEILYWYGGIYLDLDVIVLKSFQPLYKYAFTIGRETDYGLCNGAMVSSRGNYLMQRWHLLYRFHDKINEWAKMSVHLPQKMLSLAPEYFHVEENSMDRPNWSKEEILWIYGPKRVWNWQEKNYCVHLWFRMSQYSSINFEIVNTTDSMFGDMLRFVLYGKVNMNSTSRAINNDTIITSAALVEQR